jgi:phosphoribosylamine--glycine ligase/phosphoribosylformylglycinamidine cyclo-ligase
LPLLDDACDLAKILLACSTGKLDSVSIKFKNAFATTVVGAAPGYPGNYPKGILIDIPKFPENVFCFHAGTELDNNGDFKSTGGRVLSVTAIASTLLESIENARYNISKIKLEGMHYRTDIGAKALKLKMTPVTYADAGVSIDNGFFLYKYR